MRRRTGFGVAGEKGRGCGRLVWAGVSLLGLWGPGLSCPLSSSWFSVVAVVDVVVALAGLSGGVGRLAG